MIKQLWNRFGWNTKWKYHDIRIGIHNIILWLPTIYRDRWWDYSYLYKILRFKLDLMEKGFRERGCHKLAKEDAKKIKKCVLLLDRLIEEDYYNKKDYYDRYWEMEKAEAMIDQDLDLLFETLRKHIRTWWD